MTIDLGIFAPSFLYGHLVKIYRGTDRFGGFSFATWLLPLFMVAGNERTREILFLFIFFTDVQMQVLVEVGELGAF